MRFLLFTGAILLLLLSAIGQIARVDPGQGWGLTQLMGAGGVVLLAAAVLTQAARSGWLPERMRGGWNSAVERGRAVLTSGRSLLPAAAVLLGVIAVYAFWFTSAGRFPAFPKVPNFYADQAEAYLHGQLALLQQPDPRLVALADPYNVDQRGDVPFLWDSSYYQGKYYFYWGPVPAVIFAGIELITGARPLSQPLMLFYFIGLSAVMLALLCQIRARFFPRAPGISVLLFGLAAAFNLPYAFLLGRPQVYEISIMSGQFFLFLGLLGWVRYLVSERPGWLVLAGAGWGLSVGSRHTMLLSVAVYTAFAVFQLWRTAGWKRIPWKNLLALGTPLAVTALLLGLYNYARFDSPLETGATYQMTLAVPFDQFITPAYLVSNLYIWLLYPFKSLLVFPFVAVNPMKRSLLPGFAALTRYHRFDESFFGLLPSSPIFWLLVLVVPILAWKIITLIRTRRAGQRLPLAAAKWTLAGMIATAGLGQFLFLMCFYYGAMRYVVDYYLPGLLVIAFTAWALDSRLLRWPWLRAGLWLGVGYLSVYTAVLGFFGSFNVPPGLFEKNNPAAYHTLEKPVNRLFNSFLEWKRYLRRLL